MKVHRNFVKLFILALAATALSVGTSSAQEFQGKFTLSHQAQWGRVMLQPGSYTMELTRFNGGQQEVVVRSEAKGGSAAIILTGAHDSSPSLTKNDLVCIRSGGTLQVRALEAASMGETIYFAMPKGVEIYAQRQGDQPELMAESLQLIQRVPITSSGK